MTTRAATTIEDIVSDLYAEASRCDNGLARTLIYVAAFTCAAKEEVVEARRQHRRLLPVEREWSRRDPGPLLALGRAVERGTVTAALDVDSAETVVKVACQLVNQETQEIYEVWLTLDMFDSALDDIDMSELPLWCDVTTVSDPHSV
jgi:hypothetical protein